MNNKIANHNLSDKRSSTSRESGSSPAQSLVWIETDGDTKIVCKISKCVDFVTIHEDHIGKILNHQNHQNIVKYLGTRSTSIDINSTARFANTFADGKSWNEDTTMWEYLDGASMFEMICDKTRFADDIVISCVTQVVFALLELQKQVGFVHGDLNLNNIIVCKTIDTRLQYVLNSKTVYVETYGYISKIVDFGNSHAWKFPSRLTSPMYGFYDCKANLFFDEHMDFRIFLENVSDELFKSRSCQMSAMFQRLAYNMTSNFVDIEADEDVYNDMDDELHDAYEFVMRKKSQKSPKSTVKKSSCDDENEDKHDSRHTLECLLSLVELPIDFSTELSDNEMDKCDALFENGNKVVAFLNSWAEIKRFFTEAQARYVLREIVLFASKNSTETGSAVEGQFNALIHRLLKIFGQTMISVEMYKTTKVLLHLLRLSKPLKLYVTYACRDYLKNIFDRHLETIDMFCAHQSSSKTFAKSVTVKNNDYVDVVVALFNMWKEQPSQSEGTLCSFFNPYNEFASIERRSLQLLTTCKKGETERYRLPLL